jgi:hypothetical protein
MHEDYLLTAAEVSGALLGFVGVILVLGRRAEGIISNRDRSGLFHLAYGASGALFYSLLMYVFLASFERQELVWRVGVGICSLHIFVGVSKAILEGRGGGNRLSALARNLLSIVTFAVLGMNIAIILGFLTSLAPFAFLVSITLMIAVAVSYFLPFVFGSSESDA